MFGKKTINVIEAVGHEITQLQERKAGALSIFLHTRDELLEINEELKCRNNYLQGMLNHVSGLIKSTDAEIMQNDETVGKINSLFNLK
jgi:hypothetical protein